MQMNKRLKRKSYFVTEAIKIIKEYGIGNLTARAVAEAAGFNPASIYNYFENMDHLENIASIYFTEEYANELTTATEKENSALHCYIIMWELFLFHAFADPDLFYNVFYSAISQSGRHNLFKEYFELFPDERPRGGYISGMIEIDKTQYRGEYVLNICVKEKSIEKEMLSYINDIHIGYTKCIMTDIVKNKLYEPSPQLFHKCLQYIIYSMIMYVNKSYKPYLLEVLDFHTNNTDEYLLFHKL